MSRINMEPLIILPDGSSLVVSTQCSKDGDFSCALYAATISPDDDAAFRMISNHLEASTCLAAQAHAYDHAVQLYPHAIHGMRKPPYLIWHGPQFLAR